MSYNSSQSEPNIAAVADPADSRLLGELAIVVIRAQHLSDRSKIGKHHPYVVLKYGNSKTKTPVVKKGGQHPTFDAEVRFKITEDAEDIVSRPSDASDKDSASKRGRRIPKNKAMVVSVFAEDPKEPKLVGETVVDLTTVFEKCEHDGKWKRPAGEWTALTLLLADMFQLKYKDMFAGEIYLEMTYFINDAPPIPKKVPKPTSWMDYGTTGALPPAPLRQSSLEARHANAFAQPSAFPEPALRAPHRRDSNPGAASNYGHAVSPVGTYVPPPTFPGRHSRNNDAPLQRPLPGPAPTAAQPPASAYATPPGFQSQPDASHGHRHSLTGAIPQHGHWQNDQAYHQPPMSAGHGFVSAPPHGAYAAQSATAYPVHAYQSLPVSLSQDVSASFSTYTNTAPPSSSFPHLADMAMALPPLPPPPMVELPGRTTPAAPVYTTASSLHTTTTPVPENYHYPPSSTVQVNHYIPQSAPSPTDQPFGYGQLPPRPASTHVPTYPLIDNRPTSSMGMMPPPERPYSSASAHYPSAVTSSFHVSSANTASSSSATGGWAGPLQGQYATSSEYLGTYPEARVQHPQSHNESYAESRYEPQTNSSYTDSTGYSQALAYPPPPPPPNTSAWMSQDADVKPGRNYLRSLGVGGPPRANAAALSAGPSPPYLADRPADQHNPGFGDPNASWHHSGHPGGDPAYGYQSQDPSGAFPPSVNTTDHYQSGQQPAYNQYPQSSTYSTY